MKIHAYRIFRQGNVSTDAIVQHLNSLPLDQRMRDVSGQAIRLEIGSSTDGEWYTDIAAIKHEGPGRASSSTPIADFDLAEDEGFGHETAACVAGDFLILQYNHYGPRAQRIREYFSMVAKELADGGPEEIFAIASVIKEPARERLDHVGLIKRIDVSFYVPGILESNGRSMESLGSILENPLVGSAGQIKLSVIAKTGRTGSISVGKAKQAIMDLLGLREDVKQLQIVARETEDSPNEPLDFLEARLEADIPVERVGRRFGRNERWAALRQALHTWRANGQLV